MPGRWDRAIDHRGDETPEFIGSHFGEKHRRTLLVGGAGFDPRATVIASALARAAGDGLEAVFVREQRPSPPSHLVERAERNVSRLRELVQESSVLEIDVFSSDRAVTVGRNITGALGSRDLMGVTDVVIDLSALSIGASFPLTRLFLRRLSTAGRCINLHVLVVASPSTDEVIRALPSDVVRPIHGFSGQWNLETTARAAKLWMPQLRSGCGGLLERIHQAIAPDDVVPVLPFPALDPRAADTLLEEFRVALEDVWQVDPRNLVYAAENDPLDFYRTVLRIDAARKPVFETTGGSILILSPVGTKVLALGAMLAAMEQDLPVLYVEAESFDLQATGVGEPGYTADELVHVWLCGEAYAHI